MHSAHGELYGSPAPSGKGTLIRPAKEWQAGEREDEAQISRGEGTVYDNGEDFLAALEAEIA